MLNYLFSLNLNLQKITVPINSTGEIYMAKYIAVIFLYIFFCSPSLGEKKNVSLNEKIHNILYESRIKYNLPALSISIKLPNSNKIKTFIGGYSSSAKNT